MPPPEPLPREFPKDEDPSLVKRNKRMLGQLLGTLEVIFYLPFFEYSIDFLYIDVILSSVFAICLY
jgi:hypothetical protein